jgi:anti-anti-sigma regulatory factor
MLASQAAIAVENALLVAGIQRRTEELGEMNRALETSNERLAFELSERKKAEAARALLKEELFRVQTPLIPITERIMVMPVVGTIDEERARQVLETALRGVHAARALVVILDVTGVERVDAAVARMLTTTTGALRMLGAQSIITGIRSEMALALLEQGLDLGVAIIRRTLGDGIAFAMRRSGSRMG